MPIGVTASAGAIEGIARVIRDVAQANIEADEIIVTSDTDPISTPAFLAIKGRVTGVGGVVTHAARSIRRSRPSAPLEAPARYGFSSRGRRASATSGGVPQTYPDLPWVDGHVEVVWVDEPRLDCGSCAVPIFRILGPATCVLGEEIQQALRI